MTSGINIILGLYRAPRQVLWGLSFALSATVLALHALRFDDTARFAGDTWEYQSVAVNLAKGHGFPRFGELETFDSYRFAPMSVLPVYYGRFKEAGRTGGELHFYRTPAYPMFLAGVYRLAGVHPLAAKLAQTALLLAIALSLSWLGAEFWGDEGFLIGTVAGVLYGAVYGYQAGTILTEPMNAFSLSVSAVAFCIWRRKPGFASAASLGLSWAFCLLVKGSNIFIPFAVIAVMCLSSGVGASLSSRAKQGAASFILMLLAIAPYSMFATLRAGRPVFLSTQGDSVLLDNNNEYSAAKEAWAPEWREDPKAFFNAPEMAELGPVAKVFAFYRRHPSLLPAVMRYKFEAGFAHAVFLKAVVAALVVDGVACLLLAPLLTRTDLRYELLLAGVLAVMVCAACLRVVDFAVLSAAAGVASFMPRVRRGRLYSAISGLHLAFLANFVLIFVLFDGAPRFFSVVEPLFILLSLRIAASSLFDLPGWRDDILARFPL